MLHQSWSATWRNLFELLVKTTSSSDGVSYCAFVFFLSFTLWASSCLAVIIMDLSTTVHTMSRLPPWRCFFFHVAPIFALSFFGNDLGKTLIRGATGSSELNAFQLGLAGGFSGILTTAIMAPGERIKCILQVRKILEFLKPEWL